MKLALVGATGFVGSHILQEALSRAHTVIAIARYVDALPKHPGLTARKADAADHEALAHAVVGADAVITALPFRSTNYETLRAAVKRSGVARWLIVGGAGSLRAADGRPLLEQGDFPPEFRAEAAAGAAFLTALRQERIVSWTFLSPSAHLHDGPKTGGFRVGGDGLLVDAHGESHIAVADFAQAMIDEAESARHPRQRFTVGY